MTNASTSKMSIEDLIGHYQRNIERSQHDPKRILHCINKLGRMNITVHHLTTTGIGRTVNSLRKDDGEIGSAAKVLISKWKQMVANQESDGEGDANSDAEAQPYAYEDDESSKRQTELVSNNERIKSPKMYDHHSKSSASSSNHHHQHHHHHQQQQQHHHNHREPYEDSKHRKMSDSNSNKRKYSSDDTQDHSTHSKHKHKSHSRDDENKSRKREYENHEMLNGTDNDVRHKSSSKRSKTDRHHRSRHEIPSNGEDISDKNHKSESNEKQNSKHKMKLTEDDKHSKHHKLHSSSGGKTEKTEKTHKSSKHKRAHDSDELDSAAKKHKSDMSNSTASSSSRSDEKKSSKSSKFRNSDDGIEIDHSMGTSFADALGMLQPMPISSKSDKVSNITTSKASNKSSSSVVASSSSATASASASTSNKTKTKSKSRSNPSTTSMGAATATPSLLLKKPKLPPLEDLAKDLPPPVECIIPNDYKPSPINQMVMDCIFKGPKSQPMPMLSETAALCASTTSKNQRTKVYSGVKSGVLLTVPSLHELCIRFLQKNIDALEYTGGVPFEILKPVLERATPEQLSQFEHFNPYLMDDSDILWQQHCQRKFKACKRLEMETWREMFYRCTTEQDARLSSLTKNIKESQSVAMPVRQTKLAYVDSLVKPPRSVIKKQNQFGTHHKLTATPAARTDALNSVASNIARIGDVRLKTLAAMRDTAQAQPSSANGAMKPKKAPLMAKTLQLMNRRFKR